ncbi:cyclic nucleotide-binding domain-containing protein [Actinomadura atramentaria]|uniref:cyclic nucleotide-binding domain-containing protein n=1 Tax=Actinomadura atramentaria TaxID=1990 RepID=UPI00036BF754|nr:cyclic nucleotide-binding domain-containing protein [Actinomadura atramentaria]
MTFERPRRGVVPPPDDRPGRPFWDALTPQQRHQFSRLCEHEAVPAGRVLWESGAVADHVLVLREGSVRVWVERDGRRSTVAVRGPGSLIGEHGELRRRTRSAGVVTLERVRVLRIPAELLAAFYVVHASVRGLAEREPYTRRLRIERADAGPPPERLTRVRLTIQHPFAEVPPGTGEDVHIATGPLRGLRGGDEVVASAGPGGPTRPLPLDAEPPTGPPTGPWTEPWDDAAALPPTGEWRLGDHYEPAGSAAESVPPEGPVWSAGEVYTRAYGSADEETRPDADPGSPSTGPSDANAGPGSADETEPVGAGSAEPTRFIVLEPERPAARPDFAVRLPPGPVLRPQPVGGPASQWAGRMSTILFTDVAAFSGAHRTDADRVHVRRVMYDRLREAFAWSGIPWEACHREDRGDGAFIVIPADFPPRAAVDPLLATLADALRDHNHRSSAAVGFQLRIALNVGPVIPDPEGLSGRAIIQAARMIDAAALKERMAATGADLGFITSEFVYDAVLADGVGGLAPARFTRVPVEVKEARMTAWMRLWGAADRD